MLTDNKGLMRRTFTEFNKKNSAILDTFAAQDCVYHTISLGRLEGKEALKEFWERLFTDYSDIHFIITYLMAEDDTCAVRYLTEGTHTGPCLDQVATGKHINVEVMDLYSFKDNKMVEGWQLSDTTMRYTASSCRSSNQPRHSLREIFDKESP